MLDVGVVRGLIIPVLVALHAPVSPGAQRAAIVLAKRSSSSDDELPPLILQPRRQRLAGIFVPEEEEKSEMPGAVSEQRLKPPEREEAVADSADADEETEWSDRSMKATVLWANETYRARALAKRWQTLEHKGKGRRKKQPRPPLSPASQVRSDALKLLSRDEEAWMEKRLAGGAEMRRRRTDDNYKQQLQMQRGEVARRRQAARKATAVASEKKKRVRRTAKSQEGDPNERGDQ